MLYYDAGVCSSGTRRSAVVVVTALLAGRSVIRFHTEAVFSVIETVHIRNSAHAVPFSG